MKVAVSLLLLALILFSIGFALKILWYAALVALIASLVGFVMGLMARRQVG